MSDEIVSLSEFKKQKQQEQQEEKYKKSSNVQNQLTILADALLSHWYHHMENGTINEYLSDILEIPIQNFTEDLNSIAVYEYDLGVQFIVFSPGTSKQNPTGYVVGIKWMDGIITTPEMETEHLARIFAMLMYQELLMSDILTWD